MKSIHFSVRLIILLCLVIITSCAQGVTPTVTMPPVSKTTVPSTRTPVPPNFSITEVHNSVNLEDDPAFNDTPVTPVGPLPTSPPEYRGYGTEEIHKETKVLPTLEFTLRPGETHQISIPLNE